MTNDGCTALPVLNVRGAIRCFFLPLLSVHYLVAPIRLTVKFEFSKYFPK